MSTIKVNVKWGKKKLENIEVNLEEPPSVFKSQIFSLTGVLPERQKIMVKGGMLKDDADWKTLGIKDSHTFMMMGSTESDIPQKPEDKITFAEDQLQKKEIITLPLGLPNLGNTCYMNSTLQVLRAVPELGSAVQQTKDGDKITTSLGKVFRSLSESEDRVYPTTTEFLNVLRVAFPQFAQKGNNGVYMQQDAEECWTQIMITLSQKVPGFQSGEKSASFSPSDSINPNSAVAQLFGGEMESVLSNSENADEPKTVKKDLFFKLPCHITATTNYLYEGLKSSLVETISKNSETLCREAQYVRHSKISKLPYYLNIQFVRFFWKQGAQVKAKIGRPVEFPFVLDMFDFCTDELKQLLLPTRKKLADYEDKQVQEAAKRAKTGKEEIDKAVTQSAKMDIDTDPSHFVNETGFYELYAVLTHKGRYADSGHYVAWVKHTEDKWWLYDDDEVSEVPSEEIKKLSGKGGSDWHMAYLCLFRTRKLPADL